MTGIAVMHKSPLFNTDEGWSRDDTHDIGFELRREFGGS
jgi:hypothetical protein